MHSNPMSWIASLNLVAANGLHVPWSRLLSSRQSGKKPQFVSLKISCLALSLSGAAFTDAPVEIFIMPRGRESTCEAIVFPRQNSLTRAFALVLFASVPRFAYSEPNFFFLFFRFLTGSVFRGWLLVPGVWCGAPSRPAPAYGSVLEVYANCLLCWPVREEVNHPLWFFSCSLHYFFYDLMLKF